MSLKAKGVVSFAVLVIAGAAISSHLDVSWPISSVSGRWQIQDWTGHPDSSPEQRAAYAAARSGYPRVIDIRPFWRASLDGEIQCTWTQNVSYWALPPGMTGAWTTTVMCPGEKPIMLYVPPTNVYQRPRTPLRLYEFYASMNSVPIHVLFFRTGRGFSYIDYVPESWERPDL